MRPSRKRERFVRSTRKSVNSNLLCVFNYIDKLVAADKKMRNLELQFQDDDPTCLKTTEVHSCPKISLTTKRLGFPKHCIRDKAFMKAQVSCQSNRAAQQVFSARGRVISGPFFFTRTFKPPHLVAVFMACSHLKPQRTSRHPHSNSFDR